MKDWQKKLWGPTGWYTLHLLAYKYQPKHHHLYQKLFDQLLGPVLPCPKCREHYQSYLPNHPFPPKTAPKSQIILWVLDYHNEVNRVSSQTQPKQFTVDQLKNLYYPPDSLNLPINYRYIWNYLKILRLYHKQNQSMPIFRRFLNVLGQIFPCERCQKKFAKRKKNQPQKPIPYLRIIAKQKTPPSLKYQKIKIPHVLPMKL